MNNHFGKGLMAGLKATHADSAVNVTKFCADYKRGFVLGYSHRMYEKTGDRQLSAWEAGILTRRYGLDKEMVMDFFRENNSCSTLRFFMVELSPRKLIKHTYYLALINYTNASSLRFSTPPQYHDIDNHNKCVVNGASIALLILRLRQNICQVFATE